VVPVLDRNHDWFRVFYGVPDGTRAGAGRRGLLGCLGGPLVRPGRDFRCTEEEARSDNPTVGLRVARRLAI